VATSELKKPSRALINIKQFRNFIDLSLNEKIGDCNQ
jgi:hypothetical protein